MTLHNLFLVDLNNVCFLPFPTLSPTILIIHTRQVDSLLYPCIPFDFDMPCEYQTL